MFPPQSGGGLGSNSPPMGKYVVSKIPWVGRQIYYIIKKKVSNFPSPCLGVLSNSPGQDFFAVLFPLYPAASTLRENTDRCIILLLFFKKFVFHINGKTYFFKTASFFFLSFSFIYAEGSNLEFLPPAMKNENNSCPHIASL